MHDVWQGVQTLLLSYVPAGHTARHASPSGLSLFEVHSVHVTAAPALADDAVREHFAQFSIPPFAVVPQETHTFLSPLELSVVGKCVPSSLHVDSSRQDVVGVSPVTAFRYRSVVHSVHVAALVPGADNWSGLVHLAQFLIPTCFLSVSTVTPVVSLHKIQESEVSALAGFLK